MSGFDDDNPFGEPNLGDPFSPPARQPTTTMSNSNRGMEDFNPFASPVDTPTTQVRGASNPPMYGGAGTTPQPATLQPSNQEVPPPNYSRSAQQTAPQTFRNTFSPTGDMRTEEELKARRSQDMQNSPYYSRRNNWPPLPEKCCFQPCFYQDIDVEIDADFQKIVRQLYHLWLFHGLVMVLNVFGGFFMLIVFSKFSTFGLSILYLLLFTPFSFLCWFRPAYKAFKTDSSIHFMVFFLVFFSQIVVTIIQAIGIPETGSCGFFEAIGCFNSSAKGTLTGIFLLLITAGFILAAVGDCLLLSKVHRIYRSSSASVQKAQQEFTSTFLRNEHVQSAASNVAASVVRSQMDNITQQQPRY